MKPLEKVSDTVFGRGRGACRHSPLAQNLYYDIILVPKQHHSQTDALPSLSEIDCKTEILKPDD